MARPLRIEYPGAWYHVMNRGICRREVFHAEEFAGLFYELLKEAHERYQIEIHTFCLMGNHYHLCIRTPNANLGKAMQYINSTFTQKYNNINKGDGPIFKGRYKAILIEPKNYFLELTRYIHLNPVSAGIVEHPKEYKWSSYKYLTNEITKPSWLYFNEILKYFENQDPVSSYEQFVLEGKTSKLKPEFSGKNRIPILGNDEFISNVKQNISLDKQEEIPEIHRVKQHLSIKITDIVDSVAKFYNTEANKIYLSDPLRDQPRKIAIYLSVLMSGLSQSKIAKQFNNISYHWVSKIYYQIKHKMEINSVLNTDINQIKETIGTIGSTIGVKSRAESSNLSNV